VHIAVATDAEAFPGISAAQPLYFDGKRSKARPSQMQRSRGEYRREIRDFQRVT